MVFKEGLCMIWTSVYPIYDPDFEDDCVTNCDPEVASTWYGYCVNGEVYRIEGSDVESIALEMFGLVGKGIGYPSYDACCLGTAAKDGVRISTRFADGKIVRNIWDGSFCDKCHEFYSYAVANMGNGIFRCYACKL